MRAKTLSKRIEYCLFRICNSNFYLFFISFSSFFTDDTMFLALIKRHFKDIRCFYIVLFFECPTLRLLAGLVDDWQITLKKFLGVRCAQCQQLLSDFFPTNNRDALFSDQPQWIGVYAFFFTIFRCFDIAWFHL